MARIMKVGATWPPLRGQATDATGSPVDLSTALSLTFIAKTATHTITGAATAIHPAIADPDGLHFWNWQYTWATGDTAAAGVYNVYLEVLWTSTEIEYFPDDGAETLTIEAVI